MNSKVSKSSSPAPFYHVEKKKQDQSKPSTPLSFNVSKNTKKSEVSLKGKIKRAGQSILRLGKRILKLFTRCFPCIKREPENTKKINTTTPLLYRQAIEIPEETAIQAANQLLDSEWDLEPEGLFRIASAKDTQTTYLKQIANRETLDFHETDEDSYLKCNLLKALFRENIPLFDKDQTESFLSKWDSLQEDQDKVEAFKKLIAFLPQDKKEVFKKLVRLLISVAEKSGENQMNASNLATLFPAVVFNKDITIQQIPIASRALEFLFARESADDLFPESVS